MGAGVCLFLKKGGGLMVVTKLQRQILLSTFKQSASASRLALIFYQVRD